MNIASSPLQLDHYYFTKIALEAHEKGDANITNVVKNTVEISTAVGHPRRFRVQSDLDLLAPEGKQPSYTGSLQIVGFFTVDDAWPPDQINTLVYINAPSLLFGALREMIITLTARGPAPAVLLNTVTFRPGPEQGFASPPSDASPAASPKTRAAKEPNNRKKPSPKKSKLKE